MIQELMNLLRDMIININENEKQINILKEQLNELQKNRNGNA